MKHFLSTLALAFVCVSSSFALGPKWGVEAGWDFRNLKHCGPLLSAEGKSGWFVGPKAALPLGLGFRLEGSALYKQRKVTVSDEENEASRTLSYIDVPISIRYRFPLGQVAGVFLTTGPQWSWYISNSRTIRDSRFERSSWGWNVGAGAEFFSKVQLALTYNIGLGDDFKSTDINALDLSRNSFQARLSVLF